MNDMSKIDSAAAEPVAHDAAPSVEKKRRSHLWLMFSLPLLLGAAGLYFWLTSGATVSTDNAAVGAPIVTISSEISGRIVAVGAKENQRVKAGDMLFRIDPRPFQIALLQAQAQMGNARLSVNQAVSTADSRTADVSTRSADIAAAVSGVTLAQENFVRQSALFKRGFTTRASLDQARAGLTAAQQGQAAAVSQRQASIATASAARAMLGVDVTGHSPQVTAAMAMIEKARLDLDRAVVRSPIDGIVTQADRLQLGNTATQALPMLSIVGGGEQWIEANFKETQLAKIRIGQAATVEIDAIPGKKFRARVTSIGAGTGSEFSLLPPQNATGNWVKVTQRVPVRLMLIDKPGRPLVAGWSTDVSVRVKD